MCARMDLYITVLRYEIYLYDIGVMCALLELCIL